MEVAYLANPLESEMLAISLSADYLVVEVKGRCRCDQPVLEPRSALAACTVATRPGNGALVYCRGSIFIEVEI